MANSQNDDFKKIIKEGIKRGVDEGNKQIEVNQKKLGQEMIGNFVGALLLKGISMIFGVDKPDDSDDSNKNNSGKSNKK